MMPMLAVVNVEAEDKPPVRLWIPLVVIWVLLLPFLVILAPFAFIGAAVIGLNPFEAMGALAAIVTSLTGTRVEVESPDARVFINIS